MHRWNGLSGELKLGVIADFVTIAVVILGIVVDRRIIRMYLDVIGLAGLAFLIYLAINKFNSHR